MQLILYHAPGACSRVTMNALEEIGEPFEDVSVNISQGEQNSAEYKAINPKGKVPALQVDGRIMTENAAILFYLNERFPKAGLLPKAAKLEERQAHLADLLWCSSTLHPLVRQVRNPARMTSGDASALQLRGLEIFTDLMGGVNTRLREAGPWWYVQTWSIVDVYLNWAYDVASSAGFELDGHESLVRHREAVRAKPSFQRARERELAAAERLGIIFPPGFAL